jgi:hypothetical protein
VSHHSYRRDGDGQHDRLVEYETTRQRELSTIFADEIAAAVRYEKLTCRLVLILGRAAPQGTADEAIRDLIADTFDLLYEARRIITQSRFSVVFPLLRRAFEMICLIEYFAHCPERAVAWTDGQQIPNSEVRKFLGSLPALGECGDGLRRQYGFLSEATHPNRGATSRRWLGSRNQFVLGAIAPPDLERVGRDFHRLLGDWFWFGAAATYPHKELAWEKDPSFLKEYLQTADQLKTAYADLARWLNEGGAKEDAAGGRR